MDQRPKAFTDSFKRSCLRAVTRFIDAIKTKRFLVDTAVVIVLSWVTGIFNEVWLVGMPWAVSLKTRELATITNLLTAGIYGWYYDTLRHQAMPWVIGKIFGRGPARFLAAPLSSSTNFRERAARRFYSIVVGYVAFITFQSQVYRLNLWLGGATPDQVSRAVGLAAAVFPIFIEFVFSPILDACRKFFNVAPPEMQEGSNPR